MTQALFTSARIFNFKKLAHIQAMASHSLRQDGASIRRLRPGAAKGAALHWSSRVNDPGVTPDDFEAMRDVEAAFKAHKARHSIGETANGGLGIHLMLIVSAAWLEGTGGIHDADNPRVQALFREAMAFSENTFGTNSVYAARIDLDEVGAGVVDLFLAPHGVDGRTKKKNPKLKIKTSSYLTALRLKHGERKSYCALQNEWADWCQMHLSPSFQRGVRKSKTRAEHLDADDFKEACSIAAQAEADRILNEANLTAEQVIREAEEEAKETAEAAYSSHQVAVLEIEEGYKKLDQERSQLIPERNQIERKRQVLERELEEVGRLKKWYLTLIESLQNAIGFLGKMRLTVEEREAVKHAEGVAEVAAARADDMAPTP